MEIKQPLAGWWGVFPAATEHTGSLGRLYKSGRPGVRSAFNKAAENRRGTDRGLWDDRRSSMAQGEERGPVFETQLCILAGGC